MAHATAVPGRRPPVWRRRPSRPANATLALLGILLLAAAIRAVWVICVARQPLGTHDPAFYISAAEQLSQGKGYHYFDQGTTAYFPPGFPYLLGGLFWIVRHTPIPDDLPDVASALNGVLGTVMVGLVYLLGRRLVGVGVGLTAAALIAVWPNLVFHSGGILSEPLFIDLLLTALLVLLWEPWDHGRVATRRLVGFGAVLGLAALTRPPGLMLIPALFAAGWLGGAGPRRALVQAAIAFGVALAVISPWTVRNAISMHSPILVSTNVGDDLCYGHNPDATGAYLVTGFCEPPELPIRRETELRHYKWNTKEAWTYATHHPRREVELLGLRARWGFGDGDNEGLLVVESYKDDRFIDRGLRRTLFVIANTWYYACAALALFGLYAFVRRRDDTRLLMMLFAMLGLILVPLMFIGEPRYHLPVLPFVALLAAVPVTALIRRLAGREVRSS
jgi:4-amino-4-deoxy-L-arabinose transferase-like glycosyltransferase